MQVRLECKYCGHKWNTVMYHVASIKTSSCPKCADTNLRYKELGTDDLIDGYKGCPPFPTDKTEIDEYDLSPSGDY